MGKQRVVIWLTGIPAAGKSTIGAIVERELRGRGLRVENLDAEEMRANLSPHLGYTAQARDENTKRLAWMAQLLSKHGANVIVAAVSPLRRHRDRARQWCSQFVEVFVDCPIQICQQRDPKGLYARAARGEVNDIAGMHMPYEEPLSPEVHCRTDVEDAAACGRLVVEKLEELGHLLPHAAPAVAIGRIETKALRKYVNPKMMNGVDIGCGARKIVQSAIGLDVARNEITDNSAGAPTKAELIGNGEQLIFQDDSLDYVVARHSLEHIGDPLTTCQEWVRVLKPGGHLCLVLPNAVNFDPPHGFDKQWFWDNVVQKLRNVEVVEYDTLPHEYSFNCILRKQTPSGARVRVCRLLRRLITSPKGRG